MSVCILVETPVQPFSYDFAKYYRQLFYITPVNLLLPNKNVFDENCSQPISCYCSLSSTAWKVPLFGLFLVRVFPHLYCIRRDTPYLVRMWGNTDQKNSEYGHFELRSLYFLKISENQRLPDIFIECGNRPVTWNKSASFLIYNLKILNMNSYFWSNAEIWL